MVCFARLIRCAIVVSGTRNAFAISAVVRPPTARSVKEMAEAGVSAGWQHMKRSTSVSSPSARRSKPVSGPRAPPPPQFPSLVASGQIRCGLLSSLAKSAREAQAVFRRFRKHWIENYPVMLKQLEKDLSELLHFFRFPPHLWREWIL
jgi:hypothetical protein